MKFEAIKAALETRAGEEAIELAKLSAQTLGRAVDLAPKAEVSAAIIDGSWRLADDVAKSYPYMHNGRLTRALAGSLALNMMAGVDRYTIVDPALRELGNVKLSGEAVSLLRDRTRMIHDIDHFVWQDYVEPSFKPKTPLQLSSEGSRIIEQDTRHAPPVDQFYETRDKEFGETSISIERDGTVHYLPLPERAFAHKIRQSLSHFAEDGPYKASKYSDDALRWHAITASSRHPDDILGATHRWIAWELNDFPSLTYLPYDHPNLSPFLRGYFDRLVAVNPDSHYLQGLTQGKEFSFSVLKLLREQIDDAGKKAAIDAVSKNVHELRTDLPVEALDRAIVVDKFFNRIAADLPKTT